MKGKDVLADSVRHGPGAVAPALPKVIEPNGIYDEVAVAVLLNLSSEKDIDAMLDAIKQVRVELPSGARRYLGQDIIDFFRGDPEPPGPKA